MSERATRFVSDALGSSTTQALKRRDRDAPGVYRGALAAIGNAQAVPLTGIPDEGRIEASPVGAGRFDSVRRVLTEARMSEIVAAEADERRSAADAIGIAKPEVAGQVRADADLLHAVLCGLGPGVRE